MVLDFSYGEIGYERWFKWIMTLLKDFYIKFHLLFEGDWSGACLNNFYCENTYRFVLKPISNFNIMDHFSGIGLKVLHHFVSHFVNKILLPRKRSWNQVLPKTRHTLDKFRIFKYNLKFKKIFDPLSAEVRFLRGKLHLLSLNKYLA